MNTKLSAKQNRRIAIATWREKKMTFAQIGRILKISRERVHQISKKPLNMSDYCPMCAQTLPKKIGVLTTPEK